MAQVGKAGGVFQRFLTTQRLSVNYANSDCASTITHRAKSEDLLLCGYFYARARRSRNNEA